MIGIDLGTTYSCVGVWQNNTVVMVPNDRGQITTPSYVNFTDTGKRSVGSAAKNLAARYPSSTIYVSLHRQEPLALSSSSLSRPCCPLRALGSAFLTASLCMSPCAVDRT